MSNVRQQYCPRCDAYVQFYHSDEDLWECDTCGYEAWEDDDDYESGCSDDDDC